MMPLTEIVLLLALLTTAFAWAPLVYGQQQLSTGKIDRVATVLQAASSKLLQIPQFGSYGNTRCDNDGNLFFHLLSSEGYSGSVIMELTPPTETPMLFRLPSESASKMSFMEFSVTPESSVAFLEQGDAGNFVFRFDSKGEVQKQIQLETPEHLFPSHFAMAENGVIFLSGYFDKYAIPSSRGKGYAALFGPSGSLRKELRGSGDDVDLKTASTALPAGDVAVGPDGSFYFLRLHDVLVISQSGNLRHLALPNPDPEQVPMDIHVSGGLVSVVLSKNGAGNLLTWNSLVLDDSTGDVFGYYAVASEAGNSSACFLGRDGYIFKTAQDNRVKLINVPLR